MTESARKQVRITVCGCHSDASDAGGWACLLAFGEHRKELCGHVAGSSTDRLQLMALISGLGALKMPCDVELYTDSLYLQQALTAGDGFTRWLSRGWKQEDGMSVSNSDYWMIIALQMKKHRVRCHLLSIRSTDPDYLRCRQLCNDSVAEFRRMNAMDESSPAAAESSSPKKP